MGGNLAHHDVAALVEPEGVLSPGSARRGSQVGGRCVHMGAISATTENRCGTSSRIRTSASPCRCCTCVYRETRSRSSNASSAGHPTPDGSRGIRRTTDLPRGPFHHPPSLRPLNPYGLEQSFFRVDRRVARLVKGGGVHPLPVGPGFRSFSNVYGPQRKYQKKEDHAQRGPAGLEAGGGRRAGDASSATAPRRSLPRDGGQASGDFHPCGRLASG